MHSISRASSWGNNSRMRYWAGPARTLRKRSGSHCQRVIPAGLSEGSGKREAGSGKGEGGKGKGGGGRGKRGRQLWYWCVTLARSSQRLRLLLLAGSLQLVL